MKTDHAMTNPGAGYIFCVRRLLFPLLFFLSSVSFSQTFPRVLQYDTSAVCPGNVLYYANRKCQLLDRQGQVLFNFPGSIAAVFNDKTNIYAAIAGYLVAYNKDLDVLWKAPYTVHHELLVTPDKSIMFFSDDYDTINHVRIRFDNIISLDPSGKENFRWSTFDQRSYLLEYMMKDTNIFLYKRKVSTDPDSVLLDIAPGFKKDEFFHMNTIQIIPENESAKKDKAFRKGNILLCFHNSNDSLASFVAVVEPIHFRILWHYVQKDKKPIHTPEVLPDGHILMYINSGFSVANDSSLIEEIDPVTKKVVWSYTERFPMVDNNRCAHGSCQRLPNGNTLISNKDGDIYEVTPEKKIVWRLHVNDNRDLYRAYVHPKEKFDWLIHEK